MAEQRAGQIMPWCQPHWNALRAAIEARGLSPWVSKGGAAAAAQTQRELTGAQEDTKGFDPLLRAWSMIGSRAMESGASLSACPLCEVQKHHDTCTQSGCDRSLPEDWINGCTDSLLAYARELGLVPRETA